MIRAARVLLSGAVLGLLSTALAEADPPGEPSERQLRDLQAEFEDSLAEAETIGFELVGDPSITLLSEDETGFYPISLKAGESYFAAAVCDIECRLLEMELLDTDGFALSEPTAQSDRVDIAITPEEDSDYVVAIKVVRCREDPCAVAAFTIRDVRSTETRQRRAP